MEQALEQVGLQLQERPVGGKGLDASVGVRGGDEGLFEDGGGFGKAAVVECICRVFEEEAGGAMMERKGAEVG